MTYFLFVLAAREILVILLVEALPASSESHPTLMHADDFRLQILPNSWFVIFVLFCLFIGIRCLVFLLNAILPVSLLKQLECIGLGGSAGVITIIF